MFLLKKSLSPFFFQEIKMELIVHLKEQEIYLYLLWNQVPYLIRNGSDMPFLLPVTTTELDVEVFIVHKHVYKNHIYEGGKKWELKEREWFCVRIEDDMSDMKWRLNSQWNIKGLDDWLMNKCRVNLMGISLDRCVMI